MTWKGIMSWAPGRDVVRLPPWGPPFKNENTEATTFIIITIIIIFFFIFITLSVAILAL